MHKVSNSSLLVKALLNESMRENQKIPLALFDIRTKKSISEVTYRG